MTITLPESSRLLIEVALQPAQGSRFQPTGFPDLGAAEYKLSDGTSNVLVESAQSIANRLEASCWDASKDTLAAPLLGLPYVEATDASGRRLTTSLTEAHRINSPYFMDADSPLRSTFEQSFPKDALERTDQRKFAEILFKYDPNSLVHGVFMARSEIAGGRLRLPRALSGFIEAHDIRVAESGGVKNDPVNPSGDAAAGYGNVIFTRTEYTATRLTAFFNLDIAQLRGYRLGEAATRLLYVLAVFKIHRFLQDGLRLRTACDLDVRELRVTRPTDYALPTLAICESVLPSLINACASQFAEPRTTRVQTNVATGARAPKPKREATR